VWTFPNNVEGSTLGRRRFLRLFVLCSVFLGTRAVRLLAETGSEPGIIKIDITQAEFAALQDFNHSSLLVTVTGMPAEFAPVIITRTSATAFLAVTSRCTHAGCTVNPYHASVGAIFCSCHGSQYAPDGTATGGPALLSGNLEPYATEFDGQKTLTIRVPGLGFSVTGTWMANTGGNRFRIEFQTLAGVRYEIRFRQSVRAEWSAVLFATSPVGQADQSQLNGTGGTSAVYVDAPGGQGYFVVVRS
jgi:nitrite reductase/ring-hydroxylating ferredoxin subunit